jgi:transglutaminase superfamily protein
MTATENAKMLTYYSAPGPFTDLAVHAPRVRELPETLPELCRIVQGLVVHPFLAHLYGLDPATLRQDELQIRRATSMLDRMLAVDPRPLPEARPPQGRFVGNCRHFSVLLCALLRARGVPARARCGFGAYFAQSRFEDHWVCEVWDEPRGAWRLVDAQLDAVQREALKISFDPLDVPRTQFLVAGDAWQRCRSGRTDPQRFGILDLRGFWFVRGNLVRDAAACAKRELLPWDGWGLMAERDRQSDGAELGLLDHVAELTQAGEERYAEVLALQNSEPGLRVPRMIVSFGPGGDATVDLGDGFED